ncbi:MAG: hypothetical protein GX817_04460 [Elusimicrobia bacterium]|nr:hypothetical protein [Elusimicrobiota bacterium]
MLTERVMEQNRRALARINTLERGSAEPDMDTIIREFQRVLDPMLQNSATIRELREGRAPAMGTSAVSSASSTDIAELQREVATLQRELDSQRRGLEQIARARVSRGKDEGVATTSLNERELRSEIAALRRDIERQQRASSHRPKPTLASGDGEGGFPFWARVSLGLSSMSLFLISR